MHITEVSHVLEGIGPVPLRAALLASLGSPSVGGEVEKEAGALSKLKTLLTGRRTVYHGTSPTRAVSVRREGLKPQGKPGVTEFVQQAREATNQDLLGDLVTRNRGLNFLTTDKSRARRYAAQQMLLTDLGRHDTVAGRASRSLGKILEPIAPSREQATAGAKGLVRSLGGRLYRLRPSSRKGVVRTEMPVRAYRKREVPNPEVADVDKLLAAVFGETPPRAQALVANFVRRQAVREVGPTALAGKVSPKAVVGSDKFKGLSKAELTNYYRWARKNPRQALTDAWQS